MLNILVLGSCRVHRPIMELSRDYPVSVTNRPDPFWFLHTSLGCQAGLSGDGR